MRVDRLAERKRGFPVKSLNLRVLEKALIHMRRAVNVESHWLENQLYMAELELRLGKKQHDPALTKSARGRLDKYFLNPGAKPPIGFSQQTYCDPGDEVVYPSPGFPIYESFIPYVEATPVPIHLKEENEFSLSGAELATECIFCDFPAAFFTVYVTDTTPEAVGLIVTVPPLESTAADEPGSSTACSSVTSAPLLSSRSAATTSMGTGTSPRTMVRMMSWVPG